METVNEFTSRVQRERGWCSLDEALEESGLYDAPIFPCADGHAVVTAEAWEATRKVMSEIVSLWSGLDLDCDDEDVRRDAGIVAAALLGNVRVARWAGQYASSGFYDQVLDGDDIAILKPQEARDE